MIKLFILVIISVTISANMISIEKINRINNIQPSAKIIKHTLKELLYLEPSQIKLMRTVYQECKPYGLSNTCLAIAYKESKLGKYLFNNLTGDYGVMGINLKELVRTNNLKLNYWGKKELASKMIADTKMNIAAAITNLQGWQKQYKHNWRMIWGSYNGGYNPNVQYSLHILSYIKAFKIFLIRHKDIRNYIEK